MYTFTLPDELTVVWSEYFHRVLIKRSTHQTLTQPYNTIILEGQKTNFAATTDNM